MAESMTRPVSGWIPVLDSEWVVVGDESLIIGPVNANSLVDVSTRWDAWDRQVIW